VSLPGKAAPMAASAGRGPVPATARLADNDSYAEEEHTQIQPFDASLFAPEGFAKPAQAGPGSVLPFKGPAKPDRQTNGDAAAAPTAALEGLFSDLTPVKVNPSSGAVASQMGLAQSGLSQLTVKRSPMVKLVAAGAVVAVLVGLVVVVIASRPNDPDKTAQPAPVAVKPAPVENAPPQIEPETKPKVAVVEPANPSPSREVRRPLKGAVTKQQPHGGGGPVTPTALEPAPLSPDQAAVPHRSGGGVPERRVQEYRGNRSGPGSGGDGPTEAMIIAVVKKNQTTIKTCYERALKRDDRLRSGRIDVTAELGPSGTVKSVSLTAPPEFVTVEACIKTAVRRWAFPTSPKEYRAEFPLIMQGNL
jgi:hypothetical protein